MKLVRPIKEVTKSDETLRSTCWLITGAALKTILMNTLTKGMKDSSV